MPTPENSQNPDLSEASFSGASNFETAALDISFSQSPIAASISPQILSKVTRLFNAGLEDIVNELLQNARRAGATQVEVWLTELGHLRIADNGCGIESAQMLLNLGQSDWEGEIVESEVRRRTLRN
jgi:signal transduction histidine kinase